MTSSHILFIPGILMIGMFLGFILGGRAVKNQIAMQDRREEERVAARAARAAKKTTSSDEKPATEKTDKKSATEKSDKKSEKSAAT